MSLKEETNEKEERLKTALAKIKEVNFPRLFDLFALLLNSYGVFAISIGTIQKNYEEYFDIMDELSEYSPMIMERFVNEAPPELVAQFLKIFVRMTMLFPKIDHMMDLEPDEKIKLGRDLKKLSVDLRKFIKACE